MARTTISGVWVASAVFTAALSMLLCIQAAAQTVIYAAPDGSGSAGTYTSPCSLLGARDKVRTINAAMAEDIVVYLRGGWYMLGSTLTFDQSDSGTNGHTVTYAAYAGEHPVISGGRLITGWTVHDGAAGIWKATATGLNTRQLYVNCVRAVRAHSGSGITGAVKTTDGYTTTDTSLQGWNNQSDIEFIFNAVQGGTAGSMWTERRCGVASIAGTTITMEQPGWGDVTGDGMAWQSVANPTDIENAYELLDVPGEWYLDRPAGTVYYIPRSGEDIAAARVVAPILETLVSATGTLDSPLHDIEFRGITFAHATWLRPSTNDGFPELQANFCRGGIGWTPANVRFQTAHSLRFERCVFKHLGAIGLELVDGVQDCEVVGCVFTDISGSCIKIGKTDDPARNDTRARDTGNQVVNCYIHDSPCEYRGGVGVFAGYVSDLLISRNEICHTPYSAVSVGWGWGTDSFARNNQITYNDFHHWVRDLSDGGAIYTLSSQPDSSWHHNYGHDVPWGDGHMKRGWYTDEGSAYIDIHDNVIDSIALAHWYSAWTPSIHDNQIRDNFTDTNAYENNGTNCPMTNNVLVTDANWPQAALDIMAGAGIEAAYSDVKTLPCACSVMDPNPSSPPRLVSAIATSATQIELVFSEAVDQSTAEMPGNYSLDNGATVTSATLTANPTVVLLTTSQLAELTLYTLTVNGVCDLSSPPNAIAANSQLQFSRTGALLGWWTFDETDGASAADSSGNDHHGAVVGGSWTAGRVGGAIDLGAGDNLWMTGPAGDVPTFSVAFWINPRSHSDWNQTVGSDWSRFSFHTGTGGGIYCGIDAGSWTSRFSPAELPAGTLTLNTWQHFVFTYDGTTGAFYKDGVLLATKPQISPAFWNGFGASNFDGLIDDLRIYSTALNAAQAAELAAGTVEPLPQVAAPSISPAGGTFTDSVEVTMACATVTSSIRFTTDGSTPSATVGTVYSGPVTISTDATITAIAYAGGMTESSTVTATFTIEPAEADADLDGLSDSQEASYGSDPIDPDSDDDGLSDGDEVHVHGTDPTASDSDGDGMLDGDELAAGFSPTDPDEDSNGIPDGQDDWDGDGILNAADATPGAPPARTEDGDDQFSCGSAREARSPLNVLALIAIALAGRRRAAAAACQRPSV